MSKHQRLKRIKQMYGPIKTGRIRIIIGASPEGRHITYEGDLNPVKNINDLTKILLQERNEFKSDKNSLVWAEDLLSVGQNIPTIQSLRGIAQPKSTIGAKPDE